MLIKYTQKKYSFVRYVENMDSDNKNYFISKDNYKVSEIHNGIGVSFEYERNWKMSFCHEIGHMYAIHNLYKGSQNCQEHFTLKAKRKKFREEVTAWRLAKGIIKPKLWTEDHAIHLLKKYSIKFNIQINWNKFKIVELNKGFKII